MGLSRTFSEIDMAISIENRIFPPPVFCAPLKGFPWNWESAWGQKTRMMALPGRERSWTIPSTMWIQSANVTDGRTDGWRDAQTPGDSKDSAYA